MISNFKFGYPDYLGEISFWWRIWLMQMGTVPGIWVTIIGPILVTLLLIFVSIPMMEKHLLTSIPIYSQYQKQISILIPMPRKKVEV